MKKSGLQNRFPEEVRAYWLDWYSCQVCFMNQWDALHHIISPSVPMFVKGKHNESIFNSCPIHNHKCHVGNEAFLYNRENVRLLLSRTLEALIERDYYPTPRDMEFLTIYKDLYDIERVKMLKYRK